MDTFFVVVAILSKTRTFLSDPKLLNSKELVDKEFFLVEEFVIFGLLPLQNRVLPLCTSLHIDMVLLLPVYNAILVYYILKLCIVGKGSSASIAR